MLQDESFFPTDTRSMMAPAAQAVAIKDVDSGTQDLHLLCARQHEAIAAMRKALVAARLALLRDASSPFDVVARDLASLHVLACLDPSDQSKNNLSKPADIRNPPQTDCIYKSEDETSKYLNFEEQLWTVVEQRILHISKRARHWRLPTWRFICSIFRTGFNTLKSIFQGLRASFSNNALRHDFVSSRWSIKQSPISLRNKLNSSYKSIAAALREYGFIFTFGIIFGIALLVVVVTLLVDVIY